MGGATFPPYLALHKSILGGFLRGFLFLVKQFHITSGITPAGSGNRSFQYSWKHRIALFLKNTIFTMVIYNSFGIIKTFY